MAPENGIHNSPDYVNFDKSLCNGCASCVRACPTKAIRIKQGQHICMVEQCIGCGECIRVCSTGAVSSATSELEALEESEVAIAIVSPVLYAQFPGVMPVDVLAALRRIGFRHTIDLSYYIEMVQIAAATYLQRTKNLKHAVRPLISPMCPIVIRLIALKFPDLLQNILPLKRPVALMASEIKEKICKEYSDSIKPVVLYHITPCPAKIVSSRSSYLQESSYVDRSIGINEVYPRILCALDEADQEDDIGDFDGKCLSAFSGGRGLMWGMSGGEISGMDLGQAIAVSGLKEAISYLEKIEIGLLKDMDYVEFRTCPEGCLGGPLTAVDKYMAKATVLKMIKMYGYGQRVQKNKVLHLYEKGWFFSGRSPEKRAELYGTGRKPLSLYAMNKIDELVKLINGKDCSACGAPDCRTFAEDVVTGRVSLDECPVLKAREIASAFDKQDSDQLDP